MRCITVTAEAITFAGIFYSLYEGYEHTEQHQICIQLADTPYSHALMPDIIAVVYGASF